MSDIVAKLAINLASKILTEKFLAKILVNILREWSKQTANEYDDKVTEAIADAFEVPVAAIHGLKAS